MPAARRLSTSSRRSGRCYQAGTLSANPVGMRAGLATLDEDDAVDGWTVLDARAAAFARSSPTFARLAAPPTIVREGSILWFARRR